MLISLEKIAAKTSLVTLSGATSLVPKLSAPSKSALLYMGGDYFQSWTAWVGAQVPPDAENRAALLTEVERSFTPRPLIEEVVERHIDGIIGQEPSFEFVSASSGAGDEKLFAGEERIKAILKKRRKPSALPVPLPPDVEGESQKRQLLSEAHDRLAIEDALREMANALGLGGDEDEFELPDDLSPKQKAVVEKARARRREVAAQIAFLDEINSAFGAWWDKRKGHEMLHDFLMQLCTTGRAALRFYIPHGLLDGGKIKADTWVKVLDKIYLEVPKVEAAALQSDPATMGTLAVYCYSALAETGEAEARAEVTFLDSSDRTVVRILNERGIVDQVEHDCAGELFVDVAMARPLVTGAVQRNQNALNVVNTMLLHNSNLAGHRERNYINLQRPKKEVLDAQAPDGSGKKLVDDAVRVGARAANFLTGFTYKDGQGNAHIAPGAIVITDPVDPKPLIEAAAAFEDNILGAVSQKHTKISGDATASAVSRVQARFEHVKRLQGMSLKLESVMRSRMVGICALAMTLSENAEDKAKLKGLKTLRPYVRCRLNAGPLAPDEQRVILEQYEKNVRSLESTQILLGTEDVEGELQKLRAEREGSLTQLKERAAIVQTLTGAGAGIEGAAQIAGFDGDDAAKLGATDFVEADDGAE